LRSMKAGLNCYVRKSDLETHPVLLKQAKGVWMDAFIDDSWINAKTVLKYLQANKSVCVVSPELHGRDKQSLWERLKQKKLTGHPRFMICTDFPNEAKNHFQNEA